MLESNISRLAIFIALVLVLITVILLATELLTELTNIFNIIHRQRLIMM